MGLFDSIKNAAASAANKAPVPGGNKTEEVVFAALPDNLEQFQSLPQASLANPFDTAALTVLALCFYPQDKDASLAMLDFLRGPRPLSTTRTMCRAPILTAPRRKTTTCPPSPTP